MFNISEIVKKTEEMFDLFNKHFYTMENLPTQQSPYPRTAGVAHMAGAASMKSGMPTADFTEKSTYVPSTLTAPLRSWPPRSSMK